MSTCQLDGYRTLARLTSGYPQRLTPRALSPRLLAAALLLLAPLLAVAAEIKVLSAGAVREPLKELAAQCGVAVRKDAPMPDIATPETLKRALLDAKAVAYVDPTRGTSGRHFDTVVLPALGIANEVRSKAKLRPRAAQPSCCAGARPTSPSSR